MNEKTTLILPPYPEFSFFGHIEDQNPTLDTGTENCHSGELISPRSSPRIFFCTGAAMWLEKELAYSEDRESGDEMNAAFEKHKWLDAAFGRIPPDQIVFVKNDEVKP